MESWHLQNVINALNQSIVILSPVIGVCSLVLGYYQWKGTSHKSLSLIRESNNNHTIFDQDGKGTPCKLTEITIRNDGRVFLTSDDFVTPILLRLTQGQIISTKISKRIPAYSEINLYEVSNTILLTPILMNPRDSFTIEIISFYQMDFEIKFRIKGISRIKEIGNIKVAALIQRRIIIRDAILKSILGYVMLLLIYVLIRTNPNLINLSASSQNKDFFDQIISAKTLTQYLNGIISLLTGFSALFIVFRIMHLAVLYMREEEVREWS